MSLFLDGAHTVRGAVFRKLLFRDETVVVGVELHEEFEHTVFECGIVKGLAPRNNTLAFILLAGGAKSQKLCLGELSVLVGIGGLKTLEKVQKADGAVRHLTGQELSFGIRD